MPVFDPANSATDRIRLKIGDVNDLQYFPDNIYQYYLSVNSNNESKTAKDMAMMILALLARNAKERLVQIEVYGTDYFNNYRQFLYDFLKDPRTSFQVAMPYAGGISNADIRTNEANPDTNSPWPHQFSDPYNKPPNLLNEGGNGSFQQSF